DPGHTRLVLPAPGEAGQSFAGYSAGPVETGQPVLVVESWDGSGSVRVLDDGAQLTVLPAAGIDPDAGWQRVRADGALSGGRLDSDACAGVLDALRRALAHELIGQSRQMLRLAI